MEVVNPFTAPHPMRDSYEDMMTRLPKHAGEVLTAAQLKTVLGDAHTTAHVEEEAA
jgi:hypothetical protein